ncbi:chaplin [Peterkaempfera bronchialis]|uniref:Chaplin n=1 Tax=Peterkaempfera bronchialis TaxID=2126346 RepID=A0A345SYZ4_9ACTN|nr:chaplin [Peterkaempfera bronchialis]AXI78949.1 chaplin [Peterkaempfera bronchialis]
MRNIKKAVLVSAASVGVIVAGATAAAAQGADAKAAAIGSPGVISGNAVQVPIDIPINLCGNSINVVGILNPAFGNTCINASGHERNRGFEHIERERTEERGQFGRERGHERGHERGYERGGRDHGRGGEHGKRNGGDDC